ncbi:MAG: tetratricopeptide repeat protein [Spirochaetia bacterium]
MKIRSVAFLAAGAAMLLASCATVARGPRTPTLSIELFDSKIAPAPAIPAVPLALSLPLLPPAVLMSALPAQDEARLSADAGLTVPVPRKTRALFFIADPALPPPIAQAAPSPSAASAPRPQVAPVPAAASAPASAAVRQASPAPAASLVAPRPQSAPVPSGTSAASAPVPSSSSAIAASSAPAAAPDKPYGRLREIYARQGDVLQVGLDGVGFLFLGFPDVKGQADGMSFKSKENRNDKTWFTFQAQKLGTYDLDFLQQNNAAGTSARETVRVHVVSDQDFNAAVAQQPAQDSPVQGTVETGDPAFAQKLSAVGSYQAAVAELLKGYKDGNPALNDQIAGLYLRMGSYDAAGKYYGKNLSPASSYTPAAVVGLVRIAVSQNDQQGLISYLRQFLALKDPSMEEPLIQAVRMEKARSEIGMALDLAGEYVTRFPDGTWRDEADYLTAQLLEADSQFRDISRARELYSAILADHPESAFADAARLRVQYIDRHFIEVR